MSAKRLSLNTGPRPLHLVDGNVPSTRSSVVTDLPEPPRTSRTSSPRRQSSISYHSTNSVPAPLSPLHGLTSGLSLPLADRSIVVVEGEALQGREPLTLVEKHSELLHFIAQKEAKCLELRSQLAAHEAELIQLKRKWERIVNRGFMDSPSSSQANGAVLEGIVEGVQGVGRFIAAGLAIGELSPAQASPSVLSPPLRPKHANSQSNSSVSTSATKSTRLSQSSVSSLGEYTAHDHTKGDDDQTQILMVHDTGATPTMSPNPAFEHQRQQRIQRIDPVSPPVLDPLVLDAPPNSAKLLRRRSRGPDSRTAQPHEEDRVASSQSPSSSPLETMEAEKIEAARRLKRATINGTSFPPVSSIPGLAALTVGPASSPVPSWVGSVGKKWEELQRGSTFSKNQKRASVLLSDVSQSIVSVLTSPPLTLTSPPPPPSSYFDPLLAPSRTPTSLLDDDEDSGTGLQSSEILIPSPSPIPQPIKPDPVWQMLEPSTATRPQNTPSRTKADDEEDWNW
ncbi:hypothetical protein H0H87_005526 [Tephrocybe sp. NHM501043]|nr:hypothetical protein H0H87_005526 [Tephrocybe sp. NHM501043]